MGFFLIVLAFVLGMIMGRTPIDFNQLKQDFIQGFGTSVSGKILFYVRLPRTISTLVCGASLAVSGAVIQQILSNRLASPSIIGVNSGAGLAVTMCTALGFYGGWQLSLFAFAGAFATVMLVSFGAGKWGASRGTVILMGVATNSLLNAVSDTIVTFVPDISVMSNDFKIGEFTAVTYQKLIPAVILISITIALLLTLTNELDVFELGEDNAKGLGMNTSLMRTIFLMCSALLAGCAVSIAGLLSFVGLIIPHIVRRIVKGNSFQNLSLCALFGATFVCLCDIIARTAFAPYEIPVGIIMAFLGTPFFVFILIKGKGGHSRD